MNLLKNKNIKKIAMGNPKTAPYGKATLQAFESANIYHDIKSKLIFAESISQTLSYAVSATDIGIVATSSMYSEHMKKYKHNINWFEVDSALYKPISQGIVLLKQAKNNNDAKLFYNYILSEKAKKIFLKYGYLL
jgi:molybdate transport system substrate-binding protein